MDAAMSKVVPPTSQEVGRFIDSKAGRKRTLAAIAGRLIEEAAELGLDAGLTSAEVLAHVADGLHNQALKASAKAGKTVFPSELRVEPSEDKGEEPADIALVLLDYCYVGGIDLHRAMARKWAAFTRKLFRVSPAGTLYAVKPHVTG